MTIIDNMITILIIILNVRNSILPKLDDRTAAEDWTKRRHKHNLFSVPPPLQQLVHCQAFAQLPTEEMSSSSKI